MTKQEVLDAYLGLLEKNGYKKPTTQEIDESKEITRWQICKYFKNTNGIANHIIDELKIEIKGHSRNSKEFAKAKVDGILKSYIHIRNKLKRSLTWADIKKEDRFKKSDVQEYIGGGLEGIDKLARETYPNEFHDKPIRTLLNDRSLKDLRKVLKKYDRFVITTAVTNAPVDEKFFKTLKKFCKAKKAKLLIMLCSDPAKHVDKLDKFGAVDPLIANETIIFEDSKLNDNLHLSTIKLSAKAINPVTGLARMGKKRGSFIYAAPKFFLEFTSVRNNKDRWPHAIMTTGAVTKPDYVSEFYMSQRTARIAEFDHKMGAIFVEVQDDEIYHFRQIECLNDQGKFYFENKLYSLEKPKIIRPEGFIMGDLHVGSTCSKTRKAWIEIIKKFKPKKLFLHDAFNGTSVNGHIAKDIVERYKLAKSGLNSLEKELIEFSNEIEFWSKLVDELVIVPSNHNDWLERWLRSGSFIKDDFNQYTGACLYKAILEDKYPLRFAVEEMNNKKLDNVIWLGRNDDYFVGDVQLNCHGDIGVNGSRGTIKSMETAYGSSVSGHGHTAGIVRNTKRVGTSTFLQEGYNNGPGTWTNTSSLIYDDGSTCLYNAIAGMWRK